MLHLVLQNSSRVVWNVLISPGSCCHLRVFPYYVIACHLFLCRLANEKLGTRREIQRVHNKQLVASYESSDDLPLVRSSSIGLFQALHAVSVLLFFFNGLHQYKWTCQLIFLCLWTTINCQNLTLLLSAALRIFCSLSKWIGGKEPLIHIIHYDSKALLADLHKRSQTILLHWLKPPQK